MTCKTCIKLRKAAFAAIRTVVKPKAPDLDESRVDKPDVAQQQQ